MKINIKKLFAALVSLYVFIELVTLSKAFSLLYDDSSPIALESYRPIALATIGLGFILFFLQIGFRAYQTSRKRRIMLTSVLMIPLFFAGGQVIGMWVSNHASELLTDNAKQKAVKSAFYRMNDQHDTFFPFLLEWDSRSFTPKKSEVRDYILTIPSYPYNRTIDDSADALFSLYLSYKEDRPSGNEWYIANIQMKDRLNAYSAPLLSKDRKRQTLLYRPINVFAPMVGDFNDAMLLSFLPDMSPHAHSLAREQLRMHRYGFLIGNEASLDHSYWMSEINMQQAVSDVLDIDRTVDKQHLIVKKGYPVHHLIWTEKLPELIPDKGYISSIPFDLSARQFFQHPNVKEIISTHMPFFLHDNTALIPLHQFGNVSSVSDLTRRFYRKSDPKLKDKSAMLWAGGVLDKMEQEHAYEIPWYDSLTKPLLAISFSVPVILIFSTALMLVNVYQISLVMGYPAKKALMMVSTIAVIIIVAPKEHVAFALNAFFDTYLPFIGDTLHKIGLEQDII